MKTKWQGLARIAAALTLGLLGMSYPVGGMSSALGLGPALLETCQLQIKQDASGVITVRCVGGCEPTSEPCSLYTQFLPTGGSVSTCYCGDSQASTPCVATFTKINGVPEVSCGNPEDCLLIPGRTDECGKGPIGTIFSNACFCKFAF
jgi:hypothetical protein